MMKRTEVFSRPSVVDITIAVARVNAGDWFDPYEHEDEPLRYQPLYWACDIFDLGGKHAGDGCGRSAGEALAMAWIMLLGAGCDRRAPHRDRRGTACKFRPAGGSS